MDSVEIVNKSHHPLPSYATELSAGMDLRAFLPKETVKLNPGARALIPTGIFIAIPNGYEAQVRPRSGLALKWGITVLNSPGTIDADYRGEIGIILINHGTDPFEVVDGERIAQLVLVKHEKAAWNAVTALSPSERGAGGFGHTGNH